MTPCVRCKTTYRHDDITGCCSGCGNVFRGLFAFEAHFGPRGEDGRKPCLDPTMATRVRKDGVIVPVLEISGRSRPGQKPIWTGWVSTADRLRHRARFAGVRATLVNAPNDGEGIDQGATFVPSGHSGEGSGSATDPEGRTS